MYTAEEKTKIASSIGEEVINRDELLNLFSTPDDFEIIAYDGFELSGIPSLGQVFMKAYNVNQLVRCGCTFKFWIADYFTMLNNKMDGDMNKIKIVGEYMIEVWKAAGMDISGSNNKGSNINDSNNTKNRVEFLWASEEINRNPDLYWRIVMDIAKKNNLTRMKKCIPILGRSTDVVAQIEEHKNNASRLKSIGDFEGALLETEAALELSEKIDGTIPLSYLMYATMQAADVLYLNAHICQLGMDQKKVNMLVREYVKSLQNDKRPVVACRPPPVIISHHMIMGLGGTGKASKSIPDSGIFVNDTPAQVKKKIRKSFCVPKDTKTNPILDRMKYIIFPNLIDQNKPFVVDRKHLPTISFNTYEELESCYGDGDLHPSDLKPAVIREINLLLDPIRQHFSTGRPAELLKTVTSYKITR